ncbi:hypothetical protein [Nocardia sp. NPDC020380]|uniref:hypothetical protein n=1 Tax=Nocardia sp. NPDC020380 TaxID=3364309 RepID=UPI003795BDBD
MPRGRLVTVVPWGRPPAARSWPGCAGFAARRALPAVAGPAQDVVDLGEQSLEIGIQAQQP